MPVVFLLSRVQLFVTVTHLRVEGHWEAGGEAQVAPAVLAGKRLCSALERGGRNDAKAETPILWPPHVKS